MRFGKFLIFMGFITVLALTYIHMQMEIIDLAYEGNAREQKIKKLVEENGNANYKILMLKSANHIGKTMLDDGNGMQFADRDNILQITTSESFSDDGQINNHPTLASRANNLISLLSFGVTAEAKTPE